MDMAFAIIPDAYMNRWFIAPILTVHASTFEFIRTWSSMHSVAGEPLLLHDTDITFRIIVFLRERIVIDYTTAYNTLVKSSVFLDEAL